jgi:hypothetical protein
MASRRPRGRIHDAFAANYDPLIALLIAAVELAQRDAQYVPGRDRWALPPNEEERQSAAEFLGELRQSACRRLVE